MEFIYSHESRRFSEDHTRYFVLDAPSRESSMELAEAVAGQIKKNVRKNGFIFLSMTESINAGLGVGFSGIEPSGGKSRLVGTVGEVLGFETEAVLLVVGVTVFSLEAVEEVAGVELNAGFGGKAG